MSDIGESDNSKSDRNKVVEFYKEAGQIFRHYSNIRITITTTLLTANLSIWAYCFINIDSPIGGIFVSFFNIFSYSLFGILAFIFGKKSDMARIYLNRMEGDWSPKGGPYSIIVSTFSISMKNIDGANSLLLVGFGLQFVASFAFLFLKASG